jgi:hypothetical protein
MCLMEIQVADLSNFQNARLSKERRECRANAEQLARLANNVRAIMDQASTPLNECPSLDIAYNHLLACAESMAEYR